MHPGAGVWRKAPDDGVLRGRVGAKGWLCQLSVLLLLGFILFIMCIVFFAEQKLVLLLVFLLIGCLALAALRTWFYPFAWLGLDLTLPVVFDLGPEGLEVGSWRQLIFQRRFLRRAALRDLRVYRAAVDFSADKGGFCYEEPEPLTEAQVPTLELELPRCTDVVRECGRSLVLFCAASRAAPGVACAFLAAKVDNEDGEEEIVPLSRCAWHMRDVERLRELAQEARGRTGVKEALAPEATVVGASAAQAQGEEEPPAEESAAPPRPSSGVPTRATGAPPTGAGSQSPADSSQQWTLV